MDQRTRFGDYLLLKKLSDDPLGEIYRAGRIEEEALKEIFLLRIFSVPGIDPAPLVEEMREYAGGAAVEGPGLTHAVDYGAVGGVAYVAYEYVLAWDLKTLQSTIRGGFTPLGTDHAVLLAERIAKGLAVVHHADGEGGRPFHGFLIPHTVLVSGEGEVRLTGFEFSRCAIEMVRQGKLDGAIRPYLSPEALAGEPLSAKDDVYSLGAILWELLTGEVLPADAAVTLATTLATATLADSGELLPEQLADLLQRSLAAAHGRMARADLWHHQLSGWMAAAEVKATHFDLAFFIHEQFRPQIQRAGEEVAEERRLDLSPQPIPAPADSEVVFRPADLVAAAPPARRLSSGLVIAVVAAVVAVFGSAAILMIRQPPAPPPPAPAPVEAPAPPVATTAGSSSADLDAASEELQRLIRERAEALTEQLAADYDQQITLLQEQLREAAAAEAEAIREAAEVPAEEPEEMVEDQPVAEVAELPAAEPPESEAESDGEEPTATPAAPPPEQAPTPVPEAAPVGPPEPTPPPEPAARAEEPEPEPPPAAAPEPEPAPPPVIVRPALVRRPTPEYPPQARRLRKEATVLVRVYVNERGRVIDAEPILDRTFGYGFDQEALKAARQAVYRPATRDGVPIKMWTTLTIVFKL